MPKPGWCAYWFSILRAKIREAIELKRMNTVLNKEIAALKAAEVPRNYSGFVWQITWATR